MFSPHFKLRQSQLKYLVCDHCQELLSPYDVEGFWVCPYCNYQIPKHLETEDFIFSVVSSEWTQRYVRRMNQEWESSF